MPGDSGKGTVRALASAVLASTVLVKVNTVIWPTRQSSYHTLSLWIHTSPRNVDMSLSSSQVVTTSSSSVSYPSKYA